MLNENEDFNFPESNESPCSHCERKFLILNELMDNFLALNDDKNSTIDDLFGLFEGLYDDAYEEGEKEAYENIAGFALDMAHGNSEE